MPTCAETMCLQAKDGGKVSCTVAAAGRVYKHTIEFVHLGEANSARRKLSVERSRRLQASEGLVVLRAVQYGIYDPWCALAAESAEAECRGDRDATLGPLDVEHEHAWLR